MVTVTIGQDGLLFTKPGSGLVRTWRPQMSAPLGPVTCCALLVIPVLVQGAIRYSYLSSCSGSHVPNTLGYGQRGRSPPHRSRRVVTSQTSGSGSPSS